MMIFSVLAVFYGLFLVAFAVRELWIYGYGSPAVHAPPQKLVTTGPYALFRNPLVIGNLIYYAGIIFLVSGSLEICLLSFVATAIPAYFYHKYIEEPELEKTFGDEYADYKRDVPGLIPFVERKPIQNLKQYFFRK
ncbi:isoprenylcysteine carboxylmethyltransferase family protein [Methanolapillus millepedarum]